MSKIILYDHPMSYYAQKVRIILRWKDLDFEKVLPPNLGSGLPDETLFSANIHKEVPALADGDFKVFDSKAISMYLEDKWPSPTILAATPELRANARMIEEVCGTHYEAINWAVGEINWFGRAKGAEADRLMAAAKDQTKKIQEWLVTKLEGPWFNGETAGFADICVVPIVNRSILNGFGPDEGKLREWFDRAKEMKGVPETFEEVAEMMKIMAKAPTSGGFAPHSGRRREYRDHRLEFMVKNGAIGIVQKGLEDDNIRFNWPHV